MIPISFGKLLHLWWLGLVPVLVIVYALDGQSRRRVLERIGHLAQVRRMVDGMSVARRRWKAILTVIAVGLLAVAPGRPQSSGTAHLAPRRGLDIVVALDFSRSMLAADVYPSRLDRAKRELDQLIDGLKGDRVGLVAFAGVTLSYPLTTDYPAAKLFWRDLGPGDIPVGGTNLSGAIKDALELLEHGTSKQKAARPPAQVIVLLTDGADTEGGSIEAAREAARRGVKIYTVGIGTPGGDFVALKRTGDGTAEYLTDASGQPVRMQLDSDTLRQMATISGGDFFQVDPARFGVDRVQRAIAGLERTEEEARVVQEPDEAFPLFLGPAILLLLIEALLGDRRWTRRRAGAPPASSSPPRVTGPSRMAAMTLLLLVLSPALAGFDLFERPHPDVEEGNRLMAAGKPADALAAYDRALAARPDDPVIHYDRGAALYQLGKLPEARAEFQRAAEAQGIDPALKADALYNMGNAHLKQDQAKEALEAYKRTLGLRPDDRRAKWNLELALRKLREEQQKKDQPSDGQPKPENKDPDKQKQDKQKQEQKQQDQQQQQQSQDQKGKAQDKSPEEKQGTGQEKAPAPPEPDKATEKPPEPKPEAQQKPDAQKQPAPGQPNDLKRPVRDIDRQDAEAILDAFERVEPTVQKDLARRRAGNRRARKDW